MTQNIICKKGKCIDKGTLDNQFYTLFNKNNIVERIQIDLIRKNTR